MAPPCRWPRVRDADCVLFLQRALPHLGLRWPGYRRVRGQVCTRIARRIRALGLDGLDAYEAYLGEHSGEWPVLEAMCSIPVSRFYRDRAVFDALGDLVLPELAGRAVSRTPPMVRCWSAGCASGEEPYTLRLLWDLRIGPRYPGVAVSITATDVNERLLDRARAACYTRSSLRELPAGWIDQAFDPHGRLFCLRERWRQGVEFLRQDLRHEQPSGEFDLVLCRNVAFTYFCEQAQRDVLARIGGCLASGGFLVIGDHESLPSGAPFRPTSSARGIYRRLL